MKVSSAIYVVYPQAQQHTAESLCSELNTLGFEASSVTVRPSSNANALILELRTGHGNTPGHIYLNDPLKTPLEQALQNIPFDFEALPLVTEGESKILRRWTEHLVIEKFKPTVYSFTHNRYGHAEGTEAIRARFSAEVFRRLQQRATEADSPQGAFVALIEDPQHGPLTVQRYVESCNLEIRVKRFHIGSPLHRYRFTENVPTTQSCGPLTRWSRFDQPIVCFDWRHPLTDPEGNRLADEPLPDDYAAVWVDNVPHAKHVARQMFTWLEDIFATADLILVDICFFIDRSGRIIFGEISPDCMRVRARSTDLEQAGSFDKDLWRNGLSSSTLKEQYQALYNRLFLTQHDKETAVCHNSL